MGQKIFYLTEAGLGPVHSDGLLLCVTQIQVSKHDLLMPYPYFSDAHHILKSTVTLFSNLFHQFKWMIKLPHRSLGSSSFDS